MPLFTSKKQLVIKEEDVAGVIPAGSMTDATNATLVLKNASLVPEIESLEQEYLRSGFTASPNQVGAQLAVLEATFDLKGTSLGTVAAGAPNFSPLLKAAMMVEEPVTILTLTGGITNGPFLVGDIVTDATTNTARVLKECHNGDTTLYVTPINGTMAVGSVTGSVPSGLEASSTIDTAGVNSNGGFAWTPTSTIEQQITIASATGMDIGDTFRGENSGALGRVSRTLTAADTTLYFLPLNNIPFQDSENLDRLGPTVTDNREIVAASAAQTYVTGHTLSCRLYEDGIGTTAKGMRTNVNINLAVNRPAEFVVSGRGVLEAVADLANLTGVSLDLTTAPVWNSSTIAIGSTDKTNVSEDFAPCLEALTYDFGNELSDVFCSSSTTGLREVATVGRTGTGTMDPEATPEGVFPWVGKWQDASLATLDVTVGTTLGQKFLLSWPGAQITGAPIIDKNGRMARNLAFRATGTQRAIVDDNEFTLIYLTNG